MKNTMDGNNLQNVDSWEKSSEYREAVSDIAEGWGDEKLKSFIRQQLAAEREEIARQLEMSLLFDEKVHMDGYVVDWPSRIRSFIKYYLQPEAEEEVKNLLGRQLAAERR